MRNLEERNDRIGCDAAHVKSSHENFDNHVTFLVVFGIDSRNAGAVYAFQAKTCKNADAIVLPLC